MTIPACLDLLVAPDWHATPIFGPAVGGILDATGIADALEVAASRTNETRVA